MSIILPNNPALLTPHAKTALAKRAEQHEKGKVRSFVIVVVEADGTVHCDFDLKELTSKEIGMVGAGVEAIYNHLAQMQHDTKVREATTDRALLQQGTGALDELARSKVH